MKPIFHNLNILYYSIINFNIYFDIILLFKSSNYLNLNQFHIIIYY